jgi:hypothetical protein
MRVSQTKKTSPLQQKLLELKRKRSFAVLGNAFSWKLTNQRTIGKSVKILPLSSFYKIIGIDFIYVAQKRSSYQELSSSIARIIN